MTRLLVILVGLLLGIVAIEAGLRASGLPHVADSRMMQSSLRWIAHPFQPYARQPNARFELSNDGIPERIVTNSYGFRAHEFPHEKRAGDFFILCFGGSTTFGYQAPSNADTWPERLEALLQERYPDRNIKVFNLGVDMATTVVSLVNLATIGVHVDPDLIIVYHGYNEVAALGGVNHRTDHAHFYRDLNSDPFIFQAAVPGWLRSSYFLAAMSMALDKITGANDLGFAARLPRVSHPNEQLFGIESSFANYRSMHALAASCGARALFSTFQFRDGVNEPNLQRFNRLSREYFERSDFDYVDQDALIPDEDTSLQVDTCHFTQKGRDLMASNFFAHIVERGLIQPRVTE